MFKHSSSDINLNLLLVVAKFILWFTVKHSYFLAWPGPVFHSLLPSSETDMFSEYFSSSSALLHYNFSCSLANCTSTCTSSLLGLYNQPESLFCLTGSVSGHSTFLYVEYSIYCSSIPRTTLGLVNTSSQIIS